MYVVFVLTLYPKHCNYLFSRFELARHVPFTTTVRDLNVTPDDAGTNLYKTCGKRVLGQNGSGQNGTDKMVWTKWYGQNGTDKMVRLKYYG